MPAVKVTLMFNASTKNPAGQTERLAGFSESYYSLLGLEDAQLKTNWEELCQKRAQLLATNVSIIGSRYQAVDPAGGSRQYDNKYPPGLTSPNDLPGVALQFTVRGLGTANQRSMMLRGVPDACVATGEYTPAAGMGGALTSFFNMLQNKWMFRAINREVLPVRIASIVGGIMTTVGEHGLVVGNTVNVMSTRMQGDPDENLSYRAFVAERPSVTTVRIASFTRNGIRDSLYGKVRKVEIIYPSFQITPEEIQNPTASHRKAGAPFKKFRGRRTARR